MAQSLYFLNQKYQASLLPYSVEAQLNLCQTCSETGKTGFLTMWPKCFSNLAASLCFTMSETMQISNLTKRIIFLNLLLSILFSAFCLNEKAAYIEHGYIYMYDNRSLVSKKFNHLFVLLLFTRDFAVNQIMIVLWL